MWRGPVVVIGLHARARRRTPGCRPVNGSPRMVSAMLRRVGIVCVLALAACAHTAHGHGASAVIDWARVRNPILGYPDRATKDPALVWTGGRWHALFSSVG